MTAHDKNMADAAIPWARSFEAQVPVPVCVFPLAGTLKSFGKCRHRGRSIDSGRTGNHPTGRTAARLKGRFQRGVGFARNRRWS
jgi:hypothetical protein